MSEVPILLRLRVQLLLYVLNGLYLYPQFFSLLPFQFSPPSHQGTVSKWLCGPELPMGVSPQHSQKRDFATDKDANLTEEHVGGGGWKYAN